MDLLTKTDLVAKYNRIQKDTGWGPHNGNWISQLELNAIEFMEKLFENSEDDDEEIGENEQLEDELDERFEELESKINRMLELCRPIAPEYVAIIHPIVANMLFMKQIDFSVFDPALKQEATKMTIKFKDHVLSPEYSSGSLNLRLDRLAEFVDNQRKHSEFHMSEIGYFIPMSSRRTILKEVQKNYASKGGGKACCSKEKSKKYSM